MTKWFVPAEDGESRAHNSYALLGKSVDINCQFSSLRPHKKILTKKAKRIRVNLAILSVQSEIM